MGILVLSLNSAQFPVLGSGSTTLAERLCRALLAPCWWNLLAARDCLRLILETKHFGGRLFFCSCVIFLAHKTESVSPWQWNVSCKTSVISVIAELLIVSFSKFSVNDLNINTVDQLVWLPAYVIGDHSVKSGFVSPKVVSVLTFHQQAIKFFCLDARQVFKMNGQCLIWSAWSLNQCNRDSLYCSGSPWQAPKLLILTMRS